MLPPYNALAGRLPYRAFLVTYDLHRHKDYRVLHEALRRAGAARLCESVWVVKLPGDVVSIRTALLRAMDNDDTLAVIELPPGADWATFRAYDEGTDFLSDNVTERVDLAA